MKRRVIIALMIIAGVVSWAAGGLARERTGLPKYADSQEMDEPYLGNINFDLGPQGPCGWFNPEGCEGEWWRWPNFAGCTDERIEMIDERSTSYPHRLYIGEPTSDYVEIDQGCKRDFEQATIYVTHDKYANPSSHVVSGPVREFYLTLGEALSDLGWPVSYEWLPPYDRGSSVDMREVDYDFEAVAHRYQFQEGWVYWHPDYESPLIVMDLIHAYFQDYGGTQVLGFPRNNTGVDSHVGDTLFQAFDLAVIFENIHGDLEIFQGSMLDAYLEAANQSRGYDSDNPGDAEAELGLPTSDDLPTPNGSVRLLHSGTIYYRDSEMLGVFPKTIDIIDGRVVHSDWIDADADDIEILNALHEDPYLPDYRKRVVREATSYNGLCGDDARDAIGTISTQYCSEFVREVYTDAGIDTRLWGGGIFLWSVTYAKQLRWIFQNESRFVWASGARTETPEPGDYLSQYNEDHSAIVLATSIDGHTLWKVGGNEGSADCVRISDITYFDGTGNINGDITGFGKLKGSFF